MAERTRAHGELERSVMQVLWAASKPLSAAQILEEFQERRPAYTTVLTVLDRLETKGEVVRSGDSPRRQRFAAARSEQEYASSAMISALQGSSDRSGTLLKFAGDLADGDLALLRRALGTDAT